MVVILRQLGHRQWVGERYTRRWLVWEIRGERGKESSIRCDSIRFVSSTTATATATTTSRQTRQQQQQQQERANFLCCCGGFGCCSCCCCLVGVCVCCCVRSLWARWQAQAEQVQNECAFSADFNSCSRFLYYYSYFISHSARLVSLPPSPSSLPFSLLLTQSERQRWRPSSWWSSWSSSPLFLAAVARRHTSSPSNCL